MTTSKSNKAYYKVNYRLKEGQSHEQRATLNQINLLCKRLITGEVNEILIHRYE